MTASQLAERSATSALPLARNVCRIIPETLADDGAANSLRTFSVNARPSLSVRLPRLAVSGSLPSHEDNPGSRHAKTSNQARPRVGGWLVRRDGERRDGKENASHDTQPGDGPHHKPAWRRRATISVESPL